MIKDRIGFENTLTQVNEWWVTGKSREAERYPKKRTVFSKVKSELSSRRIIILTGPRRVGKSTLIQQLIQDLIDSGVPKDNIFYYQLDSPNILNYCDQPIQDIIEYATSKTKGQIYVFLDEIQAHKEWYKWIKSYYDQHRDIKLILSGSSSLSIQTDANKYLRGRTIELELFPLDFREFLYFDDVETPNIKNLDSIELIGLEKRLADKIEEYILVGGFPEWFEVKQTADAKDRWFRHLLGDVPKKAIYEDIAVYFNIKNPKLLDTALSFIAINQSKTISYEKINEVVNLDRATLLSYLEFLKSSYLILEIPIYGPPKKQIKAMKKFLLIDQGLRNSMMKEYVLKEDNKGFIIENVIGITLALSYENVTYWKDQSYEIDFVVNDVPIEVKYQNVINERDYRGVIKFLEKNKKTYGIVITKDRYEEKTIEGKKIKFIPFWLFLLEPKI